MTLAIRHTCFMVGRQLRNLMREPIWIALLLVQPMVWLLLYGQLFKRVTHLPGGGFGTASYITFLAPAIVIMNAFFGATWSGMAMISDLDRDVLPRFLATPVSRISLVVSQIVRSALIAVIQGVIILFVSLALGVSVSAGLLGWVIVLAGAGLMNSAFAGLSQGIALLVRKEATMSRPRRRFPALRVPRGSTGSPAPHWRHDCGAYGGPVRRRAAASCRPS